MGFGLDDGVGGRPKKPPGFGVGWGEWVEVATTVGRGVDAAGAAEALAVVVSTAEGVALIGSLAASGIGTGVGAGAGAGCGGTLTVSGVVVGVAEGATGSAQGLRVRITRSAMHATVAMSPLTTATTCSLRIVTSGSGGGMSSVVRLTEDTWDDTPSAPGLDGGAAPPGTLGGAAGMARAAC